MNQKLRLATLDDVPVLHELIAESSRRLQKEVYSAAQIEAALGPVFGVDEQMIADGSYFVVEGKSRRMIGCGGWSFREAFFGGRGVDQAAPKRLNPETDAARIRAFFVHPDYARMGVGSAIMQGCEKALIEFGFKRGEISATLVGEPLYQKFGYTTEEYYEIPLENCESLQVAKMTKQY